MGICLLNAVPLRRCTFAIGIAPFIGIPILIVYNVMADKYRILRSAINGDPLVGQHNPHRIFLFRRSHFIYHAGILSIRLGVYVDHDISKDHNRT